MKNLLSIILFVASVSCFAQTQPRANQIRNTPAGGVSATNVQSGINELDIDKIDALVTHRRLTANHSLDATDLAHINSGNSLTIEMNVGSANTLTVPANSSFAFPVGTVITAIQYGAGQTSMVAGGGVTLRSSSGVLTSPGQYSPMVIEKIATDEWYLWNGSQYSWSRAAVAVSSGTLTLDVAGNQVKNFDLTTTQSGNFTVAFSNATNLVQAKLTLRVTGTITVTMPSAVIMDIFEQSVVRWNDSTNVLTLTGTTASPFYMEFYSDGTNIWCHSTNRGL